MQNKRVGNNANHVESHSPNIVTAAGNSLKPVGVFANVRAWHYRPRATVPVESKRLCVEVTVIRDSHGPNIVAATGYCVEATIRTKIGAWYDRPCAAVPMQCQSLTRGGAATRIADGPHIVAATGCCPKAVRARGCIRTCYVRPCAAIPMQRQRYQGSTGYVVRPYRPHVTAAAGCSEEVIMCLIGRNAVAVSAARLHAWVRAWYQRPYATVPVYRQRPIFT
jgi:hypothetical protein